MFPDTWGGMGSLVYFAGIAARAEAEFRRDYLALTDDELLDDLAAQIWRNAEIVCDKYRAVQAAIRWATLSLLLLIATLIGTSLIHQALPRLTGG